MQYVHVKRADELRYFSTQLARAEITQKVKWIKITTCINTKSCAVSISLVFHILNRLQTGNHRCFDTRVNDRRTIEIPTRINVTWEFSLYESCSDRRGWGGSTRVIELSIRIHKARITVISSAREWSPCLAITITTIPGVYRASRPVLSDSKKKKKKNSPTREPYSRVNAKHVGMRDVRPMQ